jgi:4-diphosphocytidyl-2-C-methyl-D-erythritol kinase
MPAQQGDDVEVQGWYAAPAKINLFLHVIGRRPDGYHLIESVMQLVDLADRLLIEPRADGRIVRESINADIADEDDLAMRAARMLQHAADVGAGATIAIDKRIPLGGGLGGGSSDAATTLLALNRLWELNWSRPQLADIGLTLGADVPFFLEGRAAFVEGIGERITPIALPEAWYVIVHPGISVATATIFADAELTRDTAPIKISGFSTVGTSGAVSAGSGGAFADLPFERGGRYRNDLEAVAATRFDAVREALTWLSACEAPHGASGPARMSGSGACVIRAFANEDDAARCAQAVPAPWSAWCVRSLAAHAMRAYAPD